MVEKEVRGPRIEMQNLFNLIEDVDSVSWNRRDDLNVLRDICWAHLDSFQPLNMFSIVLVMDNIVQN